MYNMSVLGVLRVETVIGKREQAITYADGRTIIARSLKEPPQKLEVEARKKGLEIHQGKIKYMKI